MEEFAAARVAPDAKTFADVAVDRKTPVVETVGRIVLEDRSRRNVRRGCQPWMRDRRGS
jgi:hypothetical protein